MIWFDLQLKHLSVNMWTFCANYINHFVRNILTSGRTRICFCYMIMALTHHIVFAQIEPINKYHCTATFFPTQHPEWRTSIVDAGCFNTGSYYMCNTITTVGSGKKTFQDFFQQMYEHWQKLTKAGEYCFESVPV